MNKIILLFLIVTGLFCNYLSAQTDNKLNKIDPADHDYKANFFKNISKEAHDSIPSLGSMLVWRKNGLVYEEYFGGANENTAFKVKSVTKTIVSALAGIAFDKGLLPDLKTPVVKLLPEYDKDLTKNKNIWFPDFIKNNDSLKRTLTLWDLITMQSGFLWDDNNRMCTQAFHNSSDPARYMMDLPFETSPGTRFRYCTGGSHLVGVIVSKYVKTSLQNFADSTLFKPLGITVTSWTSDGLGRNAGGTELSLKARDMMKFGLLYLNEGKVNGKQLISKSWINASTSEQAKLNEWDVLPGANGYGYYWWRRKTNGHQAFVASGYGGQLICVIPDLKMVIVTTCFVNDKN
ncbi:MAG: serine hydrolase, partial [Bacteroidia bacterium]